MEDFWLSWNGRWQIVRVSSMQLVLNVMDASGKCKGVLTRKISLVVIGTMLDYIPSVSSFLDFLLIPFNKVILFSR